MTSYDDLGRVQFCLGGLVCQLRVLKFSTALGLCTKEFKEKIDLHALNRHIHRSPSRYWDALVLGGDTYHPSRSKASTFPPSLSTDTSSTLPISSPSRFNTRQSGIGRGSSPLAPTLLGWLDTSGSSAP
ncbi:uncharacterized protein [Gossypium hirsutum]|uniref:Uncharacterized protein n=1 Tax=Gossypium hirsutum TaxID=3635 RepID=A0ABM3BTT0_GOSHI|nr:uncharacterized protein LOC121229696 [Gossypium hirsutum]